MQRVKFLQLDNCEIIEQRPVKEFKTLSNRHPTTCYLYLAKVGATMSFEIIQKSKTLGTDSTHIKKSPTVV